MIAAKGQQGEQVRRTTQRETSQGYTLPHGAKEVKREAQHTDWRAEHRAAKAEQGVPAGSHGRKVMMMMMIGVTEAATSSGLKR